MRDPHERALKALERRGRLRALSSRSGVDFASNDYLGLATSPVLRDAIAEALTRRRGPQAFRLIPRRRLREEWKLESMVRLRNGHRGPPRHE